jgi:hypothetical protein
VEENQNQNSDKGLVQEGSDLKRQFTTVASPSNILALVLFVTLPFLGFWFGSNYSNSEPRDPSLVRSWATSDYFSPEMLVQYPSDWDIAGSDVDGAGLFWTNPPASDEDKRSNYPRISIFYWWDQSYDNFVPDSYEFINRVYIDSITQYADVYRRDEDGLIKYQLGVDLGFSVIDSIDFYMLDQNLIDEFLSRIQLMDR